MLIFAIWAEVLSVLLLLFIVLAIEWMGDYGDEPRYITSILIGT